MFVQVRQKLKVKVRLYFWIKKDFLRNYNAEHKIIVHSLSFILLLWHIFISWLLE
jgi:hypothetical protein